MAERRGNSLPSWGGRTDIVGGKSVKAWFFGAMDVFEIELELKFAQYMVISLKWKSAVSLQLYPINSTVSVH